MSEFYNEVQILKLFKERMQEHTVTLYASRWSGETAPYGQLVEVSGVEESNIVFVTPETSYHNMQVMANSQVLAIEQSENHIMFYAYKDKPSEDITLTVAVGGEG